MGLARELTDSATSIGGVCMPGARLLDIIKLNPSSPGPGPRCENYINRNLEGFIAARQADAKFVVDTLPHRYYLYPDLPVHDETALSAKFGGKRLLTGMIVRVALDSSLKTAGTSDVAIPTVTSSPTISQETAAVTPQYQCSRRLQPISYAGAVRKYPVLDCADKSGSAAAASSCFDTIRSRESCWCHRTLREDIANYTID
ncbi:hypothetical protein J6590_098704 [Homalodisca vitripennis]|nr:hypothetical protein J6590_098704 [Homalodisca vitripennis]